MHVDATCGSSDTYRNSLRKPTFDRGLLIFLEPSGHHVEVSHQQHVAFGDPVVVLQKFAFDVCRSCPFVESRTKQSIGGDFCRSSCEVLQKMVGINYAVRFSFPGKLWIKILRDFTLRGANEGEVGRVEKPAWMSAAGAFLKAAFPIYKVLGHIRPLTSFIGLG